MIEEFDLLLNYPYKTGFVVEMPLVNINKKSSFYKMFRCLRIYKNLRSIISIHKPIGNFNFRKHDLIYPTVNNRNSINYMTIIGNENYKIPSPLSNFWALSILTFLGFSDDDEEKESELIMTLKRSVLCIKREQFDKAEQLLHIALKIAQEQQNDSGIVYCFDLMANLAFEQRYLDKAEKLFVVVLQHLLSKGTKQDDLKVIHISLKLARIYHLKADMDKAELGYQWCLETIDNQKNNDLDSQILYGVILDWFAQYFLDKENIPKALDYLKEAYKICEQTLGLYDEKSMLLLNDLGITSFRAGDMKNAELYLNKGIQIGNKVQDQTHVGVLHANLGLVLLHQGIVEEAEKYCKEALKLGKKNQNEETIEQANYCRDQIKINLGG